MRGWGSRDEGGLEPEQGTMGGGLCRAGAELRGRGRPACVGHGPGGPVPVEMGSGAGAGHRRLVHTWVSWEQPEALGHRGSHG